MSIIEKEIATKDLITKSNFPASDYVINPYLPKRDIDKPALAVELKWNQSAGGAIAQIKKRQYRKDR